MEEVNSIEQVTRRIG